MMCTTLVGIIGPHLLSLSTVRSTTKTEYKGMVAEVRENYFIFSSNLEKFYIYTPYHPYEVGDILVINGDKEELDFNHLESEFDFGKYLNNKGVYSELIVKKIDVQFYTPIRLNSVKRNFLEKLDDNSKGIVGAILFASGGESELNDVSRNLHIARLISSSGIYLYFIHKAIKKLLSLIIKKEKIVDLIVALLFLPYVMFTFPKFTVLKFFAIRLLMYLNTYLFNKRFTYLEIISFVATIFLLINYHYAYQDGFFLACFIPIISLLCNDSFKIKNKILKNGFVILIISISFIPFAANYYHELSPLSVFWQMLLTPLFLFLFIISLFAFIGIPLYEFIYRYTFLLTKITKDLSYISPKIYIPEFSNFEIFFYLVLLLLLLYFASIKLRPMKNVLMVGIIGVLSFYLLPISFWIKDYVMFINVGQGDSTLIKYHNSSILIDTGGNKNKDIANEVLIPLFKRKQIYTIDLLITTHDDFDHSGAVLPLINNFTVKKYVKDYSLFPLNVNGLTLRNYNVYPDLWSEENDKSLVIGFNVNNHNYLIMGDAPKKIESQIIKDNEYIPCDILKVGHHGSKTSTSDEFIRFLKPTVGVISCGKNNYYGHPHKEVIAILKKYGVLIRRTDIESSITFWQINWQKEYNICNDLFRLR